MKTIIQGKSLICLTVIALILSLLTPEVLYGANGADNSYIRVKTKAASMTVVGGEVQVTYETGESITYKDGDVIPPLPDGAVISVLSGSAFLEAGNTTIELNEGDAVLLFVDNTYRTTSIQLPSDYSGQLVVMSGGVKQTLSAGDTFWAPMTATPKPVDKKVAKTTPTGEGTDVDIESTEDEDTTGEDSLPNPVPDETPPPDDSKPATDSGQ